MKEGGVDDSIIMNWILNNELEHLRFDKWQAMS